MSKRHKDNEDINIIEPEAPQRPTDGPVGENEPLPTPWHTPLFSGSMLEKVRPCGLVLGGVCIASFPTQDYAGMVLASAATSPKTINMDDSGEVYIRCNNFMVFADQRLDRRSNEYVHDMKTVLFSTEGETYSTWSPWVARKIVALWDCVQPEDRVDGLSVVVRKRASLDPGKHYHDLRLCPKQVEGK